uniref:Uncharacterized protein n=1 Tax=Globisporangium ultimum (strain ATCC 200006 / CBS 805.95 / DAOM BR144) TaxID=431595 RepID=K3X6E6_GLOUD
MVHIINGEIVQDNDPRVLARKPPASAADAASSRRGVTGFGSLSSSSGPQQQQQQQQQQGVGLQTSPLQGLARMLGIEGTVTIPAVLGFPPRQVEKIYLALAALAMFLFGWRALIFIAFAVFLSSQQPAAMAPPAPPQTRQ